MTTVALTPQYVQSRLAEFDGDDRYFGADRAIQLVIHQWPGNIDPDHVLIKSVLLNRLYSTNIFDIYGAANHIFQLKIDERLLRGDVSLVNDIADMHIGNRDRYNLSFASKYCAWHQPDHFQILDNFVIERLWQYRKAHSFAPFKRADLRDYPTFIKIVDEFRAYFQLGEFSRKQIDKFLWIEGKSLKNSK